jgi:hypothetical protein
MIKNGGRIHNAKQNKITMANKKTAGRHPKPESEKLNYAYRLAFNNAQNEALKDKAKKVLGIEDVHMYLRSLSLRDIN